MIEILILRLSKFFNPKNIIICTARNQDNKVLKKISTLYNVKFFAGSEKNIFKRIINCQKKFYFKHFVRITGDNPLTDPKSIMELSFKHIKNNNDFTFTKSLASGMKPEVISFKALKKASNLAIDQYSSEYLTYYFVRSSFKFEKISINKFHKNENNFSITIDNKSDFNRLRKIIIKNTFMDRKEIIEKLSRYKFKKIKNSKIPLITKKYNVSFKNLDQQILL